MTRPARSGTLGSTPESTTAIVGGLAYEAWLPVQSLATPEAYGQRCRLEYVGAEVMRTGWSTLIARMPCLCESLRICLPVNSAETPSIEVKRLLSPSAWPFTACVVSST